MTWDCLLHTILDRVTFSRHVLVLKNHTNKNKIKKPSAHRRTMGDESWHVGLALYKNLFHYRTLSPNVTLFNKN